MHNGQLKIVRDGSFLNPLELGMAAWIIAISQHQYIIGQHFTPGPGPLQCSHRSELSGILGAVLHINDLCSQFEVTRRSAELHCDGLGAVNVASFLTPCINPSRSHFDIISSLSRAIQLSPLSWTFKHVSGHRDNEIATTDLTDWEFWNIIADREAKDDKLTEISNQPGWFNFHPPLPPFTKVTVSHQLENGSQEHIGSYLLKSCLNSITSQKI
jgi:hypothetical protein